MTDKPVLRGLTTVVFTANDLAAAKEWYTEVLGISPYYNRPAYIEFRVGDYQHELGILDSRYAGELSGPSVQTKADEAIVSQTPGGALVYWHVDDVEQTLNRLVSLGAKMHHPPRNFGEGFIGACVVDPFGNLLGIMHNPHYLAVLEAMTRG